MRIVFLLFLLIGSGVLFGQDKDSCEIYIPNVVTTNCSQAGSDYLFQAFFTCTPFSYNILVFSRWGELLFESTDFEEHWDASKEKEDVYVYKLTFIWEEGDNEIEKTGHLTLLK